MAGGFVYMSDEQFKEHEQNERLQRGAALLEYEEAKEDLTRLRATAKERQQYLTKVTELLANMVEGRGRSDMRTITNKRDIQSEKGSIQNALSLDAIFELDKQMQEARERLSAAETAKKEHGFS